ncbi:MAG: HD domain-containing protein [Alloprevotella sp.]|nr:HD domain-containing protein [Alloprevotella sp.]MBR1652829.1 HD domain-containing protein [Alloprevotella sp.]
MTDSEISRNRETFQSLCREYIRRDGLERLLEYLNTTDFYTAPSSSMFHLNEDGGLCLHSINVFRTAMKLYEQVGAPAMASGNGPFKGEISTESIAISTLFHDLCKIGFYHKTERWKKDEHGRWMSYPGYEVKDELPLGHGEKSAYIVRGFIKLNRDELLAIRWHMGMFDMGDSGSSLIRSFRAALEQSPLVSLVHSADFLASNLLEVTTKY